MDMGQGTDTGIAIMAAEELDMGIDRVHIIQGDTALTVDQGGASGSTGLQMSGVAIRYAAAEARRVLLERAAEKLSASIDDLKVIDGTVSVISDASKTVTYGEIICDNHFSTQLKWNGKYGNGLTLKGKGLPKSPDQYTLVGTEVPRKDVPGKIMATTSFAPSYRCAGHAARPDDPPERCWCRTYIGGRKLNFRIVRNRCLAREFFGCGC